MAAILSASGAAGAVAVRAVYVDAYGADPTGVTDSTAAINRAIAALGTSAGNLIFSVGSYKWGTGGNLTTLRQNQGIVGQGSEVTTFTYTGTAQAVNVFLSGTFDGSGQAGKFTGFTLAGFGTGAGSVGLQYGDLQGLWVDDVAVNGFGKAGIYGKNVNGWSEQATVRARMTQNGVQYLFDTGSFDYSNFDLTTVVNSGQSGVQLQNTANMQGVYLRMRGNYLGGAGNTGAVISLAPAGGADGSFFRGEADVAVEADGTGTGHFTILMASTTAASQFLSNGVLDFLNTAINFQGVSKTSNPVFSHYGRLNDTVLGSMSNGDAGVAYGALDQNVGGTLSGGLFASTIFVQFSDITAFQLANGATTIVFAGAGTWGRRMDLYIKQPSSGAAGTITWPTGAGGVKWSGGAAPALSTVNGRIDHIRLTLLPAENSWFGELIGTNYA